MAEVLFDATFQGKRFRYSAGPSVTYLALLLDLLSLVPDVVWSGVIASVLTLGGVLVSNRSNTARLRIQLQHDGEQKAKERTAVLRREVYLEFVEQLTKANSHLAGLPQSDPTKTNLADGLAGFFASAAKLQLVAEPGTSLQVNKLVASYTELLLRLMARAAPLHRAKSDISIHDKLYAEAREQVTRVLGELAKFNEGANVDENIFSALQRSFDAYQAQALQHAAERSNAWKAFNDFNAQFCRQLIEDLRDVGELQITVMIEVRRDLGLSSNGEAFRTQAEELRRKLSGQFEGLLQTLSDG